ncbi:MAG: prepilin-type N-terminal cleavage/methylation domain-containing protein [bacterium]|nr:prepilin-type N-terminal cleavage/methylation domain-containing protein [bacterium]
MTRAVHCRRDHGFTLMETLVALVILSIGIVAVANLFPVGMRNARTAHERTLAAEYADSRVGRLRMERADAFTAFGYQQPLDKPDVFRGAYTTLQLMRGSEETYLQRVTFTVEMHDGRREQFVTWMSEF